MKSLNFVAYWILLELHEDERFSKLTSLQLSC